jgi:ketosteroid isomerase-like protein
MIASLCLVAAAAAPRAAAPPAAVPPDTVPFDTAAAGVRLDSTRRAFAAAHAARDSAALQRAFAPGARYQTPRTDGAEDAAGYAAQWMRQQFTGFDLAPNRVRFVTPDDAVEQGRWSAPEMSGRYTIVWRSAPGGRWLVATLRAER